MRKLFLRYSLLFSVMLSGGLHAQPDTHENSKTLMLVAAVSGIYLAHRTASAAFKTYQCVKRKNFYLGLAQKNESEKYHPSVPVRMYLPWFIDCFKGKTLPDTYKDEYFETSR